MHFQMNLHVAYLSYSVDRVVSRVGNEYQKFYLLDSRFYYVHLVIVTVVNVNKPSSLLLI